MERVVKSGSIKDPDRLFNVLSHEIGKKYEGVGVSLGLKKKTLDNELSGRLESAQDNKKAMTMLTLWQQSVAERDLTYSALADALQQNGINPDKYCYKDLGSESGSAGAAGPSTPNPEPPKRPTNGAGGPTTQGSGFDFTKVPPHIVPPPPQRNNIEVVERGQRENGTYHLQFTFDHGNEKEIEVSVLKCAQHLTFKIVKCDYLGVNSQSPNSSDCTVANEAHEAVFEDIVKNSQLSESHRRFLVDNVVSFVIKKIHYQAHPPRFGIFLSHKSKDKPIINAVKNGLIYMGYETWIDEENIGVGVSSAEAIKSGIDNCQAFLAWMNQEYFESDWCKGELKYALEKKKIIFTFGNHRELTTLFTDEFRQLSDRNIVDPSQKSLFEILRLIDEALHK